MSVSTLSPNTYAPQPMMLQASQLPPASNPADQKVEMDIISFQRLGMLPINQQVAGEQRIMPRFFNDVTSQLNPQAESILEFARLQQDQQDLQSSQNRQAPTNGISVPALNYSLEKATGNRLGIYTLVIIDALIGAIDESNVKQFIAQAQQGHPPLLTIQPTNPAMPPWAKQNIS
jgi:hypothetical protein